MNRSIAFPFTTIPDSSIELATWRGVQSDSTEFQVGDILEAWDYRTKIELVSHLNIDFKAAFDAIGLPTYDHEGDASNLDCKVSLITGAGRFGKTLLPVWSKTLNADTNSCEIRFDLPSERLSSKVGIELAILLGDEWDRASVLSPFQKGSRLWVSTYDVLLEGGGTSLFPIEAVSFQKVFIGRPWQNAPWYLDWDPTDLHLDFANSTRLLLNSDMADFVARVQNGDKYSVQCLVASIADQMMRTVLAMHPISELDAEFEKGTLGYQLSNWSAMAFEEPMLRKIRSFPIEKSSQFTSTMFAAFEQD